MPLSQNSHHLFSGFFSSLISITLQHKVQLPQVLIRRYSEFERQALVSRFRSSHHCAARSFVNFGIEGHWQLIYLVGLWFRSPHFGLAARMMRTSEPPH